MPLLPRAVHITLVLVIVLAAAALSLLCRRGLISKRNLRLASAYALAINEIAWWTFRYSHEGFRMAQNLPLQLCDVTVWSTVFACLTLWQPLIEFSYFAGLAGAGAALITPDLWRPWPSYPAIYFFVAHGGVVAVMAAMVFGGVSPLRKNATWRAMALLLLYAALVGAFDAVFRANYMYLRAKPNNATALDLLGPWPIYLFSSAVIALFLFWLLWFAARASSVVHN